jgi:DNA-binding transcriptional MerR regulator
MKPTFTAGEVSRLAGFAKPWMLTHLEREQIFCREHASDKRHGRARKYTFSDVVILRSINRLLEIGARPARIKKILSQLGEVEGLRGSRKQVEALSMRLGTRLFVTDSDAHILDGDQKVIDLLSSGQFAFGFMVEFKDCVRPVTEVIKVYEKQRSKLWKYDQPLLEQLCSEAGI